MTFTSTEAGLCDSDADYGVWTSGYSVDVPTPTISIVNGDGDTVTNGSSQPAGIYTATSTVPTTLCTTVISGGTTFHPCLNYGEPVATSVTHTCPSDSSHAVSAPAFTGWSIATFWGSEGVSNDAGCGGQTGPSGTGTVSITGETFSIPGSALLHSHGASTTISGTYTLTGSICCNSDGPGSLLSTTLYTINGTFSFALCNGPCALTTFGVGCYQAPIEDGGGVTPVGSYVYTSCSPDGSTVVDSGTLTLTADGGGGGGGGGLGPAMMKLPGLPAMVSNLTKAVVEHVSSGMKLVSDDVQEARRAICEACPLHLAASDRCSACGCFLSVKRAWETASCPDHKW